MDKVYILAFRDNQELNDCNWNWCSRLDIAIEYAKQHIKDMEHEGKKLDYQWHFKVFSLPIDEYNTESPNLEAVIDWNGNLIENQAMLKCGWRYDENLNPRVVKPEENECGCEQCADQLQKEIEKWSQQ